MPSGIYKHKKGFKHSEKTKIKIGIAHTGKHHSQKTKRKMSKAHKGIKLPDRSGEKHPFWKGGRRLNANGYILIYQPEHPFHNGDSYVYEHRLVMERHLARYLTPKEVVHHKGIKYPIDSIENRSDNRIENLQLFKNKGEHHKFHKETHSASP